MAWYEKPTILSSIDKKENYIFFDESGTITDLKAVHKRINNNETVNLREQMYVLNSTYLSSQNLNKLYKSFKKIKLKHFSSSNIIFHAVEIDNKKGVFKFNDDNEKFSNFTKELNDAITSTSFKQNAIGINKADYLRKHYYKTQLNHIDLILCLFKKQFIKLERMLKDIEKSATLVIEESSNPKIDKKILELFNHLRIKKKLIHCTKLYFTKKSADFYSAGSELVDLTAKPIYKIFQNMEFVQLLKKFYKFDINSSSSLEYFDQKIKNPAIVAKQSRSADKAASKL